MQGRKKPSLLIQSTTSSRALIQALCHLIVAFLAANPFQEPTLF